MDFYAPKRELEKPKPNTTIWKFDLEQTKGRFEIDMPPHATVLSLAVQHGSLVLWAEVRLRADKLTVKREFVIRVTGDKPYIPIGRFVGTFQIDRLRGGPLVGHLFDLGEKGAS